jgi:hypothetical protein
MKELAMSQPLSESDLLLSIQAGLAINSPHELLECFVQLAAIYIEKGSTQEGADILAYLLHRIDTPNDIREQGQALWDDLARWICPRVLYDAEDFGRKAALEDVVDYVFL